MKKIQLISSPRNISTALMYSFGNRSDTAVVDEPFYANYLSRVEKKHPAQEKILSALPLSAEAVIKKYINASIDKPIYFIKKHGSPYGWYRLSIFI